MHGLKMRAALLSVVMFIGLWVAPLALAQDKPRQGGILEVALSGGQNCYSKSL